MEENERLLSDELIEELFSKLEDAKKKGDIEPIFMSLINLLKELEKNNNYDLILDIIDDNIKLDFTAQNKGEILSFKIQSLLRLERFNDLLMTLKEKEKTLTLTPAEIANIRFYESIAYEALDEVELAIKSLIEIKDNISRYALINKYLKLSMLYVRNKDYSKAKEAYDYASLIDFNHKNDMFYLVESDLYFLSKNYYEALNSFETFFLKSPNKYKYLDRYIDILVEMNNLSDAYNFYTEYKDKESLKLSSQNRYRFLVSAKKLLGKMGKDDEAIELDILLEKLKPHYYLKAEEEDRKVISTIMNHSLSPISRYDEDKNIVFHFFRLFDNLGVNTLIYIKEDIASFKVFEYLKTRMREKIIDKSFIESNGLNHLFEEDNLDEFLNFNLEVIKMNLRRIELKDNYHNYGFILIDSSLSEAIRDALKSSIFSVLLRLETIKALSTKTDTVLSHLDKKEIGYLSFMGDKVALLNKSAKDILKINKDVIEFSEFNNLSKNKDMFVSNYKDGDKVVKEFDILGTIKNIEFSYSLYEDKYYAFIKDVTETHKEEIKEDEFLNKTGLSFFNLNYLKNRTSLIDYPYSIIGLTLNIIEDDDTLDIRDEKLDALYRYLIGISPKSELYYIGENHFLILTSTIDKRVLESIFNKILSGMKQLYKYSLGLREKNLKAFATRSLKDKDFNYIKELLSFGFGHSFESDELYILDREELKEFALYKTYAEEIKNRLSDKKMNVEYLLITNSDDYIEYFYPTFILPYDINKRVFEDIIKKENLETKADQVLIEEVFIEAMQYKPSFKFIIEVHQNAIYNENFIKNVSLLVKKYHIENRAIFMVNNSLNIEYKKNLSKLKNSGVKLATRFDSLGDLKDLSLFEIVFINFMGDKKIITSLAKTLKESSNTKIVVFGNERDENILNMNPEFKPLKKEELLKL